MYCTFVQEDYKCELTRCKVQFAVFMGAHNIEAGRTASALYEQMTSQCVLAEELGYDCVFLVEHHFNDYNLMTDPLQFAVRIFERTKRIKVGAAVIILPNHHPLQLAGRLAQLDVLYPGRFITAVGRGSSGYEAQRFQTAMPAEDSRDHFYEHLQVMARAFASDVDFGFNGRFFQFPELTLLPRPLTKPIPELWLAGVTPPSIHGQVLNCSRLGIPAKIITSPFRNPMSYVAEGYESFLRGLTETHVSRSDAFYAINRNVFVGSTMSEARATLPRLMKIHHGLYQQLESKERYVNGRTSLSSEISNTISEDEILANMPIGDVEKVREHVASYYALGVDMLSCYFDYSLPPEDVTRTMKMFAEKIMPYFKS